MIVSAAAPLLVVDRVLEPGLIAALIGHADSEGWFRSPMVRPDSAGGATLVPDLAAKARHDHQLIDEALTSHVQQRLVERLLPIVALSFAHAPASHERFKIVRYDVGDGWFGPHRDNVTPDAAHRRLAVTVNLDDSYEGGCLHFPEFGPTLYRPLPGSAIVFSCSLLHEVTPVTAGRRHALITFLW